MFEVCVYKSFILSHYSSCNHLISNYLSYRLQLTKQLIGNYCSHKRHIIAKTFIHHYLVVNTARFHKKHLLKVDVNYFHVGK